MENKQPTKAAAELAVISRLADNPELKREAGWQAAQLYEQAGQNGQAINAYRQFVSDFPKPPEQAIEARQKLVDLYFKQKQHGKRDHWRREIIKADARAGKGRTDRTRFLAAQASLALVQPVHQGFKRVRLKAPLKKNLKRKKQQMQQAISGYKKAADYGVSEVTTAATYHIGELYQEFGKALMNSERPKGLNEEELEQYEILLEEQAYPFEDKAINLHEANIKRTTTGIYDEWVKKSFRALAEILPARYAKSEKGEERIDEVR
jgi:tetratricopeptide (TPR) repeat protein